MVGVCVVNRDPGEFCPLLVGDAAQPAFACTARAGEEIDVKQRYAELYCLTSRHGECMLFLRAADSVRARAAADPRRIRVYPLPATEPADPPPVESDVAETVDAVAGLAGVAGEDILEPLSGNGAEPTSQPVPEAVRQESGAEAAERGVNGMIEVQDAVFTPDGDGGTVRANMRFGFGTVSTSWSLRDAPEEVRPALAALAVEVVEATYLPDGEGGDVRLTLRIAGRDCPATVRLDAESGTELREAMDGLARAVVGSLQASIG